MALEILRHSITGEYYAASYADGMTFATLTSLVGPLTAAEAVAAFEVGAAEPGDPDDLAWAREQPWQVLPASGIDTLRAILEEGR